MQKRPNRYTYHKGVDKEEKKRSRKEKSTILSSLGGLVGSMFKMLRNATSTSDQDDEPESSQQQTEHFQQARKVVQFQRSSRQGDSSLSNRQDQKSQSQVGYSIRRNKVNGRMYKFYGRSYQDEPEINKKAPLSRSFYKVIRDKSINPTQPEAYKPKLENLVAKKPQKARWINDQYVEDQIVPEQRPSSILNPDMKSSQETRLYVMALAPEQLQQLKQQMMCELDWAKFQADKNKLQSILGGSLAEREESMNRLSDSILNHADRSRTSTVPSQEQSGVKKEEHISITNTTSESKSKIKIEPPNFTFNVQPFKTKTNQQRQANPQSQSLFPQSQFEIKTPQRATSILDNQNFQLQIQPQPENQKQEANQPQRIGSPQIKLPQDSVTLSVEKIKEIPEADLPNPMAPAPNELQVPQQPEPKQSAQKKNFIDLTVEAPKQSIQKQEVLQQIQIEVQPQPQQITQQPQEPYNPFLNKGQQQQPAFQTTDQNQNQNLNPFITNNQVTPSWSGLSQNPFNNPNTNVSNTFNQLFQPAQPQTQQTLGQNPLFSNNNQGSMFTAPVSSQSSVQTPSWGQPNQTVDLFNNAQQQQQKQFPFTSNVFQPQPQQPSPFYQPQQQNNAWNQPNPIFPSIQTGNSWLTRQDQQPQQFYNPQPSNFFQSSQPMETQRYQQQSNSDWGNNNNLSSMSFGKSGDHQGAMGQSQNPFQQNKPNFDPTRTNMFMGPNQTSLSSGANQVVNLFTAPQRMDQTQNLFGTIESSQNNPQRPTANDSRMNTLRRNINQSNSQRI